MPSHGGTGGDSPQLRSRQQAAGGTPLCLPRRLFARCGDRVHGILDMLCKELVDLGDQHADLDWAIFFAGGFSRFQAFGRHCHQIKLLEASLGAKLFERGARSVALTDLGQRYFGEVQAVLERLEICTDDVRRMASSNEVTLTAMPSFMTRWLMPRLGRFQSKNEDVEVRLLASVPPVDFARDRVDLAIRLGSGSYPGMHATEILREYYIPVAAEPLASRLGSSCEPARLLSAGLLHDEYEVRIPDQIDWPRWARLRVSGGSPGPHWSKGTCACAWAC